MYCLNKSNLSHTIIIVTIHYRIESFPVDFYDSNSINKRRFARDTILCLHSFQTILALAERETRAMKKEKNKKFKRSQMKSRLNLLFGLLHFRCEYYTCIHARR